MPVHDWTRVSAGTFHDFHNGWIVHLKEALNSGILPEGYYARAEQQAGRVIADILTLQSDDSPSGPSSRSGSAALLDAPPRAGKKAATYPDATYRAVRRTLAIRHSSNHRIVALIEILSPANKDRAASVRDFVAKAHAALQQGCHLLVIDLFPPGPYDPHGIHAAIWEEYGPNDEGPPAEKPLSLASYVAGVVPDAYFEYIGVGDRLPEMPLFLERSVHLDVPLESTYELAY